MPFTKCLLGHQVEHSELNIGALDLAPVRELARQRVAQEQRGSGMPGGNLDLGDLPMDGTGVIIEMHGTRKPVGSFFTKAMELGNVDGIEFTGTAIYNHARELAEARVTANCGAIVLAEARAAQAAAQTAAGFVVAPGRGGRGGRGSGVSYKGLRVQKQEQVEQLQEKNEGMQEEMAQLRAALFAATTAAPAPGT